MTTKLRVVTLNIHKGLSTFNRRMVIHELRDGLGALDPDLVFLQEVQGLNDRFALRFETFKRLNVERHTALRQLTGYARQITAQQLYIKHYNSG